MDNCRPLPVRLDPARGQGLDCYLEHVSKANHISAGAFMRHLNASTDTTRYLIMTPTSRTIAVLSALTGVASQKFRAATLTAYDGLAIDLTGLDPARQSSYRTVAARGWAPGKGTQACLQCLTETGRWDISWRLPTTTVCLRHQAYLIARCPGCQRPFRDRTRPLRPVGPVTRCGNALGARGRYCQVEVTDLESTPADDACVERQSRQHQAILTGRMKVLDRVDSVLSFHEDLRSLTALLLHIATSVPEQTDLPHWAQLARREGSSERAPRWGILPPRETATRSMAMTSAAEMLCAPDIETAVSRFSPWAHLVPDTPDGFLGWVGDHTRATPNVTRLVMATHAPRRRLSRLLDASPPLTARPEDIPQSIPGPLYERHLAGLFTSRPTAVRTFAALCLARTHPGINTWADAITALELAPDAATRTVHTCTGGQVASPQEVMTMIVRAASELREGHRRDTERGRSMGHPSSDSRNAPNPIDQLQDRNRESA